MEVAWLGVYPALPIPSLEKLGGGERMKPRYIRTLFQQLRPRNWRGGERRDVASLHYKCIFERPLNILQIVQFLVRRLTMWYVTWAAFRSKTFHTFCILDQSTVTMYEHVPGARCNGSPCTNRSRSCRRKRICTARWRRTSRQPVWATCARRAAGVGGNWTWAGSSDSLRTQHWNQRPAGRQSHLQATATHRQLATISGNFILLFTI